MTGTFTDEYEGQEPKHYGFYMGTVVNNADPQKRGRVRIDLPGIQSDMKWAVPIGMPGSGGPPGGSYILPEVGAQVIVGFLEGDKEHPFYMSGPPALSEAPEVIRDATTADAPKIRAFETDTFECVLIDKDDEKKIRIGTKDQSTYLEIDAIDGSILMKGSKYVILEGPLVATNNTVKIQLGNRIVLPVGSPI